MYSKLEIKFKILNSVSYVSNSCHSGTYGLWPGALCFRAQLACAVIAAATFVHLH